MLALSDLLTLIKIERGIETMNIKDGYKTTEFWVTTAISLWTMFGSMLPPTAQAIVIGVVGGAYSIARGLAKQNVLGGDVGKYLAGQPDPVKT